MSIEVTRETVVDLIEDIFLRAVPTCISASRLTMSEHMLQAALLAEQEDGSDAIAAALLHDIGHYTSEFAPDAADEGIDNQHDAFGAKVWSLLPARGHRARPPARRHQRYLCDPTYFALSPASVLSLGLQGGAMSAEGGPTSAAPTRTSRSKSGSGTRPQDPGLPRGLRPLPARARSRSSPHPGTWIAARQLPPEWLCSKELDGCRS